MKKDLLFGGVLPVLMGVCLVASGSGSAQHLPVNVQEEQLSDALAANAGDYSEVDLGYMPNNISSNVYGMQQKAWNNPLAHMGSGQTRPGYSRYNWTPDTVLPIRLREGMMTLINLPSWELIEKVHIGAPESFNGEVVSPNSMLLYADPSYLGVDGNMIIFGHSGNRYVFYLRSETFNTDKITQSVVDVLVGPRWTPVADGGRLNVSVKNDTSVSSTASMPFAIGNNSGLRQGGVNASATSGVTANAADVWKNNVPVDPEGIKFDLDMFLPNPDDVDIAPDNVWRDNIFTYIDLGPKALTMTQRPIVSLLVQDTEVPVGFRTRGANSRLIVVEAIGDLVLRNGQKVVCIKLRRDPAAGLEYTDYSGFNEQPYSYLQQLPNRAQDLPNPEVTLYGGTLLHGDNPYVPSQNGSGLVNTSYATSYGTETGGIDPYAGSMNPYCMDTTGANRCGGASAWQPIHSIPSAIRNSSTAHAGIDAVQTSSQISIPAVVAQDNIAIEFGTATEISELEKLWDQIYTKNADLLSGYDPYYSVDTSTNGDVVDLFRLRAGAIKDAETGDALCRKLGKRGYSCSVVRIK